MKALVRDECAQPNPLVNFSGQFLCNSGATSLASNPLQAFGVPMQLTLEEQLTEEYLNDIGDRTSVPSTFDFTELKNHLLETNNDQYFKSPVSGQDYPCNQNVQKLQKRPFFKREDKWHDEMSATSTNKLAAKWCEEFNSLINNTKMETIWESVESVKDVSSSLWPTEFLSQFESTEKHEEIVTDNLANEFINEIATNSTTEDFGEELAKEFIEANTMKFENGFCKSFYDVYKFKKNNCFIGKEVKIEDSLKFIEQGQLSNAILCLESLLQKDYNDSKAWYLLGLCQAENEDDRSAICAFKQSANLNPSNGNVYLALATSLANESLNKAALEQLNYWIHSHPKYKNFLRLFLQPVNNIQSDDEVFAKIEQKFLHVVRCKSNQNDADLQNALGILYSIGGIYERAAEALRIAVSISRNDPRLWNRLGAVLNNSGRSAEAVGAFRRALELFPDYVRAKYNLGIASVEFFSEAIQCFLDALALQESSDDLGSSAIFNTLRTAVLSLYPENAPDILSAIYNRDTKRLRMIL
uniref:TPR_REGION domain-containing protein n=1 Tax=Syphacia muris TaxID=451379 RepID=A0A0N5AGJ3_9BILA